MNEAMIALNEAFTMADMTFQLNDTTGLVYALQTIDAAEYILSESTE